MSVILTAGGRPVQQSMPSQVDIFDQWDRAVDRLLAVAAKSAPSRARVVKMQAWLANDENFWNEKYQERHDQYWHEKQADNVIAGTLFDMAAEAAQIQRLLNDDWIRGLSILVGHRLYPHIEQAFAIHAQRIGSDDLFEVVRAWQSWEWEQDNKTESEFNVV